MIFNKLPENSVSHLTTICYWSHVHRSNGQSCSKSVTAGLTDASVVSPRGPPPKTYTSLADSHRLHVVTHPPANSPRLVLTWRQSPRRQLRTGTGHSHRVLPDKATHTFRGARKYTDLLCDRRSCQYRERQRAGAGSAIIYRTMCVPLGLPMCACLKAWPSGRGCA